MPIHKNLVTERQIVKKDAKGIGQGHGENYIPYLRVGDFGSKGRTHRILSLDGRIHHFFSDLERDFYYMLLWKDIFRSSLPKYPACENRLGTSTSYRTMIYYAYERKLPQIFVYLLIGMKPITDKFASKTQINY